MENGGTASVQPTIAPTEAPAESKGAPAALELIEKTAKASESLKSFTMDMRVDQKMTMTGGEIKQDQNIHMDMTTDIIKEPMQMHQEIKITAPSIPGGQNITQYISQDGVYVKSQDAWMKMPDAQKDQLMAAALQQANLETQLESFKKIIKDTKVTVEGDNYIMTANVSGDSVKELAKTLMPSTGGSAESSALLDQMNITSMSLKYIIDKKSSFPVKMDVALVMNMNQAEQKIAMEMKMESAFLNQNKVAEIKVPQEALDSTKVIE
ncbi:unnamed protein product [Aphanomyces euteiches]